MTANSARKSPKVETIWAYQRRRMVSMRRTSRMDNGAGGACGRASASGCAAVLMGLDPILPSESVLYNAFELVERSRNANFSLGRRFGAS